MIAVALVLPVLLLFLALADDGCVRVRAHCAVTLAALDRQRSSIARLVALDELATSPLVLALGERIKRAFRGVHAVALEKKQARDRERAAAAKKTAAAAASASASASASAGAAASASAGGFVLASDGAAGAAAGSAGAGAGVGGAAAGFALGTNSQRKPASASLAAGAGATAADDAEVAAGLAALSLAVADSSGAGVVATSDPHAEDDPAGTVPLFGSSGRRGRGGSARGRR
jgi:hypothetical protein